MEVISPFAKAIKCLESAHATAADVYLFWLAIVAQLEQLFMRKTIAPNTLSNNVIEQIRAITNRRFDGMINDAPMDVYLTAFVLDPRMSCSFCGLLFYSLCCTVQIIEAHHF